MDKTFSTFEVVKILGINRNTLQSALAGGFVVPDVHRADGPSERSEFSINGVYDAALFFRLVQAGMPRKVAAKAKGEAELSWDNVTDKHRFLERIVKDPGHPNLHSAGSWRLYKDQTSPVTDNELFRWIIPLLSIKRQIDEGIKSL